MIPFPRHVASSARPFVRFLLLAVLASAFACPSARAGDPPKIADQGDFFTDPPRHQAELIVADIEQRFDKQVVIETFAAIPADVQRAAGKMSRPRMFHQWLAQRANALHVNGIYILICKDPAYVEVDAGRFTKLRKFTDDDCQSVADTMLTAFRAKKFDAGLLAGVKQIRDMMRANLTINVATQPATKPAVFSSQAIAATRGLNRVVFIIDATGSMMSHYDDLRDAMHKAFDQMPPSSSVNVVFFQDGLKQTTLSDKLLPATMEKKKKLEDFIDRMTPKGSTDPLPAIKLAFAMKPRPQVIWFMVDPGDFPDNQAVVDLFKRLNSDHAVINTIGFTDDDNDDQVLKKIAEDGNGVFRYAGADSQRSDAGAFEAIPAAAGATKGAAELHGGEFLR